MYHLKSHDKTGVETGVFLPKVSDGSVCCLTVVDLKSNKPNEVELESCLVCCLCDSLKLKIGLRFRLCIGQAPDLINVSSQSVIGGQCLRHILEDLLIGSRSGDVLVLNIEPVSSPYSKKEIAESIETSEDLQLTLRLDHIVSAPSCIRDDCDTQNSMLTDDPRDNTTLDWNRELEIYWLYRAWNLKERGTWLINNHLNHFSNSVPLDFNKSMWSYAFSCYSRALQLISLSRWAKISCNSKKSPDSSTNRIPSWIQNYQKFDDAGYVDADSFGISKGKPFSLEEINPMSLEFAILLNLALCQLKVGSNKFCVENCSQALKLLDPNCCFNSENFSENSITFYSSEHIDYCMNVIKISVQEICKALYRRAQAYLNLGRLDESKIDLETCIQLQNLQLTNYSSICQTKSISEDNDNKVSQIDLKSLQSGLTSSKNLLSHVTKQIKQEQVLLTDRLRNRTYLF